MTPTWRHIAQSEKEMSFPFWTEREVKYDKLDPPKKGCWLRRKYNFLASWFVKSRKDDFIACYGRIDNGHDTLRNKARRA